MANIIYITCFLAILSFASIKIVLMIHDMKKKANHLINGICKDMEDSNINKVKVCL